MVQWVISSATAEGGGRKRDEKREGSMFKRESLSGLNIPCSSRVEDFFVVQISFVRSYLPMEDPGAL